MLIGEGGWVGSEGWQGKGSCNCLASLPLAGAVKPSEDWWPSAKLLALSSLDVGCLLLLAWRKVGVTSLAHSPLYETGPQPFKGPLAQSQF